tara:strand:- start:20533 stop:22011 length:1479 start_codon:yes stop_codon:yes gene_type:complete
LNKKIVIIGAGTVGLFLANFLLEKKIKVILIESGNEIPKSFNKSKHKSVGIEHVGIDIGRSNAIGGTSNLWGGQFSKFTKKDLKNKDIYNQPKWPITWSILNKYVNKVYDHFNMNIHPNEFAQKLKGENNIEKFYTYWLSQPNFKSTYFNKISKNSLCTFYKNSEVYDLKFKKNKCTKILFRNDNKNIVLDDFNDVVLANGTLEISRLLLIIKQSPFSSNLNIGKYFQDHINFKVAEVKSPSKLFFDEFSNKVIKSVKLQPKIRFNETNYENKISVSGYFSFNSKIGNNLDNFKQFIKAVTGKNSVMTLKEIVLSFFKVLKSLPTIFPLIIRYIIDNKIYIPLNSKVFLNIQSQQISIKESCIEISRENTDQLLLNWKVDGREIMDIKNFCNKIDNYLRKNDLGYLKYEKWFKEHDKNPQNWIKYVTDIYHQSGGTIMGKSIKDSVVDKDCLVHGTKNLYVTGASVFPTSGYANTGLSSLALTLKLSDHLCQ